MPRGFDISQSLMEPLGSTLAANLKDAVADAIGQALPGSASQFATATDHLSRKVLEGIKASQIATTKATQNATGDLAQKVQEALREATQTATDLPALKGIVGEAVQDLPQPLISHLCSHASPLPHMRTHEHT